VDGSLALSKNLLISQEDLLCRLKIGTYSAGTHLDTAEHMGS
jgi:hypothetical protein